jgi:hypothetical protein
MMTCKNCNAEFDSSFCPQCGQKSNIHRVTVSHVLHELVHSITHADKGFLLLAKGLITRPGIIALEYMNGKRKKYFNPLSFLVIATAFFAVASDATGYMDALTGTRADQHDPRMPPIMLEVFSIASRTIKWLTLLFIAPLWTAVSRLFFYKQKYNYAEHFVLHSYIFGETNLYSLLVMVPLFLIFPAHLQLLNWVVYEPLFMTFLVVAYKQFFKQHLALIILKTILIRVVFVLLYWILITVYVVVKHMII